MSLVAAATALSRSESSETSIGVATISIDSFIAGGFYFVWVPSHATHLAEFVGIGRGVDLIIYIWIVISLLLLLNLHLKLRAYGADHRTGEGTCHRERPLAPIDVMSPRVAWFRPIGRLIQLAFP
jgi:hypothetical protein